jgi:hypothetical protein
MSYPYMRVSRQCRLALFALFLVAIRPRLVAVLYTRRLFGFSDYNIPLDRHLGIIQVSLYGLPDVQACFVTRLGWRCATRGPFDVADEMTIFRLTRPQGAVTWVQSSMCLSLLYTLPPVLRVLGAVVRAEKQGAFPSLQAPHELLAAGKLVVVAVTCLARMQGGFAGAHNKGPP